MQIEWLIVEKEGELVERASKEPLVIALDLKGKLLSSESLSRKIFTEWGSRPSFAIGGPEGLPKSFFIFLAPTTCFHICSIYDSEQ